MQASVDECARRDVNGLYAKAFAGEIKGFTGVDDPYEEPGSEVVVDTERTTPEGARGPRGGGGGPAAARGRGGGGESLEAVTLTPREVSDLDMIAVGALSPLEGFMGRDDYERVIEDMHLANGLPWALPVCLAVDSAPAGDAVALVDEGGRALGVIEVEDTYSYDKEREAELCFRTTEDAHPGVARLYAQKPLYLSGRVTVFDRPDPRSPSSLRTRPTLAESSPGAAGSVSSGSRRGTRSTGRTST